MNYTGNTYPFRQDSNFRYFAGYNLPGLVLTIDTGTGVSKLYGNDLTLDDIVWMGEQTAVADLARDCGMEYGGDLSKVGAAVGHYDNVYYLPPYREERRQLLRELGRAR